MSFNRAEFNWGNESMAPLQPAALPSSAAQVQSSDMQPDAAAAGARTGGSRKPCHLTAELDKIAETRHVPGAGACSTDGMRVLAVE